MKTRVRSHQNKWECSLGSDAIEAVDQPLPISREVYHALKSPLCSCVSITLPASGDSRTYAGPLLGETPNPKNFAGFTAAFPRRAFGNADRSAADRTSDQAGVARE